MSPMPTALNVGDLLQVRTCVNLPPQIAIGVMHWRVLNNTGAGCTMEDFATYIDALLSLAYTNCMGQAAQYRGAGTSRISSPATSEVVSTAGAAFGTINSDVLPKEMTAVIAKYDGLRGRAHRGRLFFPFPPENANDTDGSMLAAYKNLLYTTWLNIFTVSFTVPGTVGNSSDFQPVLHHQVGGGYTAITRIVVPRKWAQQKRRGDYGKPNIPPF